MNKHKRKLSNILLDLWLKLNDMEEAHKELYPNYRLLHTNNREARFYLRRGLVGVANGDNNQAIAVAIGLAKDAMKRTLTFLRVERVRK